MIATFSAVFAGISLTVQNSLNGLMSPIIGAMGVSLAGFIIQSVLLVSYQLVTKRNLNFMKKVPLIYYGSGLIGTLVVGTVGVCTAKMGSTVTQCCSIAGQVLMSAFMQHFGLFGTRCNRFTKKRIPAVLLIFCGVMTMNLIGGTNTSRVPIGFLLLAMCLGAAAVISRTMNFKVTQYAETAIEGGIVNSIGGAVSGVVIFICMSGFHPDFVAFAQVPVQYYFAGVFGTLCCLCNIVAYKNANVFYSTILMLIGQVTTSIIMDILVFHALSLGRCFGIIMVIAGVFLDKVFTLKNE